MSTGEARLNKLYPALSARERAILVLKALKEDTNEDRRVRETMPPAQGEEFNRYIDLMNAVNDDIKHYILVLYFQVRCLAVRLAWLSTLQLWGFEATALIEYISEHTGEPVSESEHRVLVEKARAEMVPIGEFAELLTDRHEGWTEADHESQDGERTVSDKARNRVFAEKKREIRALVENGTVNGKRRGRGLAIEAGSFYDWLGEEVPVFPEWGFRYEVIPNGEADRIARLKEERARAKEAAQKSPTGFAMRSVLRRLEWAKDLPKEPVGSGDELAESLVERVKEDAVESWVELGALDRVLAEVQEEFEGEDPLHPRARKVLDTARKELSEAHEALLGIAGDVDLADPDDEQVERVRGLSPQPARRWTLHQ